MSVSDEQWTINNIKQNDGETYAATKQITDKMDREDLELPMSSDSEESKAEEGNDIEEVGWWNIKESLERRQHAHNQINRVEKEETKGIEAVNVQNIDYVENYYAKNAKDFLKTGAMPLEPLGRREWKGMAHSKSICLVVISLVFPPEWQKITPDRKVMSWEQTVFQKDIKSINV